MPGDNCAVFGCGTCRRTKGIGIFKLPSLRNAEYEKWRKEWLNQLTKTRIIDKDFQSQIDKGNVFTCEKHFDPKDIETCKYSSNFCIYNSVWPAHKPTRLLQYQQQLSCLFLLILLFFYFYFSSIGKNGKEKAKVWSFTDFKFSKEKS